MSHEASELKAQAFSPIHRNVNRVPGDANDHRVVIWLPGKATIGNNPVQLERIEPYAAAMR
jgi:hypothetical protein